MEGPAGPVVAVAVAGGMIGIPRFPSYPKRGVLRSLDAIASVSSGAGAGLVTNSILFC